MVFLPGEENVQAVVSNLTGLELSLKAISLKNIKTILLVVG